MSLIMLPVLLTGVSPWGPADSPTRKVCAAPAESRARPHNLDSVKLMTDQQLMNRKDALASLSACNSILRHMA